MKSYLFRALIIAAATLSPIAAFAYDSPPIPVAPDVHSQDFPTFGISVATPAGWTRFSEGNVNRIACWIKSDASGSPQKMLQVEHARVENSLQDEMRSLTQRGATAIQQVKIDGGTQGFLAEGEIKNGSMTASQVFVTQRGNVRYYTLLANRSGSSPDDHDVMTDFIANWTWRKIEEPSENIQFASEPKQLFNAALLVSVPVNARPDSVKDPRTQCMFALINLKTQDDEFRVTVTLNSRPPAELNSFATYLKQKLALAEDLHWSTVGKTASLTQWAKSGGVGKSLWFAVAEIPLTGDRSASALFVCDRTEQDIQAAYMNAAQKIVESIQLPKP